MGPHPPYPLFFSLVLSLRYNYGVVYGCPHIHLFTVADYSLLQFGGAFIIRLVGRLPIWFVKFFIILFKGKRGCHT